MSSYCSVPSCFERRSSNPSISLHHFPKNLDLRTKWCEAIGPSFHVKKTSKICLKHFRKEDYTVSKSEYIIIKHGAIPSIFYDTKNVNEDKNQNTSIIKPAFPETVRIEDTWGYATDGPSFQPSIPTHSKRKFYAGDYDIKDMECAEVAKCFFRAAMKEKQEFSKRMKAVQSQKYKLKQKVARLKSLLKACRQENTGVPTSDK